MDKWLGECITLVDTGIEIKKKKMEALIGIFKLIQCPIDNWSTHILDINCLYVKRNGNISQYVENCLSI